MFEPPRTSSCYGNAPKFVYLFRSLEATDSSKYSSTTPYCVRVDRQQFLVLTLSIEQMKTFDCCLVYSSDMK